jgi:hypothetical protein
MATMWIGNFKPGTSDDELKGLLVKYGFPAFDAIEHIPGDGSRPAAILTFNAANSLSLQQLQPRVHNLFWKDRRLNVEVLSESRWNK